MIQANEEKIEHLYGLVEDLVGWVKELKKEVAFLSKPSKNRSSAGYDDNAEGMLAPGVASLATITTLMPSLLRAKMTNNLEMRDVRDKSSKVRSLMLQYLRDVTDYYMMDSKSDTNPPPNDTYRAHTLILSKFVTESLEKVGYDGNDCPVKLVKDLIKDICKGARARKRTPGTPILHTDDSTTPSSTTMTSSTPSPGMGGRSLSNSSRETERVVPPLSNQSRDLMHHPHRFPKGDRTIKGKGRKIRREGRRIRLPTILKKVRKRVMLMVGIIRSRAAVRMT